MHQPMSALPPIATAKADMPQTVMSALPPKADMCGALAYVGFGPEADITDNGLLCPLPHELHVTPEGVRGIGEFISSAQST